MVIDFGPWDRNVRDDELVAIERRRDDNMMILSRLVMLFSASIKGVFVLGSRQKVQKRQSKATKEEGQAGWAGKACQPDDGKTRRMNSFWGLYRG